MYFEILWRYVNWVFWVFNSSKNTLWPQIKAKDKKMLNYIYSMTSTIKKKDIESICKIIPMVISKFKNEE